MGRISPSDDFASQQSVNDALVAKSPCASALREGGVRFPEEVVIRGAVAQLQLELAVRVVTHLILSLAGLCMCIITDEAPARQ
jgi:hypothetical protein